MNALLTEPTEFASLLQRFFAERLLQQKNASPRTIAAYRDTFRLLFGYAEISAAVRDECADFLETVCVHQEMYPLTGSEFALFVLGIYAGLAAAEFGFGEFGLEGSQLFIHENQRVRVPDGQR